MKKLFHIILIVLAGLTGAGKLNAQQVVPLPDNYFPESITNYLETDTAAKLSIAGVFTDRKESFYNVPIMTLANGIWEPRVRWNTYYNQLINTYYDGRCFYFYDKSLNYFVKADPGTKTDKGATVTTIDSIRGASGIQRMVVVSDSLLYAVVMNNGNCYIAKKKGKEGWRLVPLVLSDTNKRNWLRDSVLWLGIAAFFAALAVLWLARMRARQVKAIQKEQRVVQDLKLRADRPLDKNQLADGDMKQAITAIANVIADRNTPLPMTIAINGAWGSGKSSIMNCIRQILEENKDRRFITTWFNAWHQQSESSLLNAFLLKVIRRCEQPFFRRNLWDSFFASLKFRTRLAATRFIKQPVYRKILTGFTIVLFTTVLMDLFISLYYRSHEWRAADLHLLGYTIDWKNLFSATGDVVKTVVTVLLPVASFLFLQSEKSPTLGAFANIIYKKNFALDAEKNAPDLREKFRSEYWEIMGALGDKTLVVFIDDLDRVGGAKIFEMLEALNFISDVTSKPDDTSQESFRAVFVLGLYVDQVAENLGSYLLESKENVAFSGDRPAKLGEQYLEKMIQLNVPVPLSPNDLGDPLSSPTNTQHDS